MISIRELDKRNKADNLYIESLARLHMTAFPDFFLTKLGFPFLKTLYKGYLEDDNSGILVAEINGKLAGFIAYSNAYSDFYKILLKRHLIRFGICALFALVRHPSFFKRLLYAFKKSEQVRKNEAYVELASICVNPKVSNSGIGSRLISHLKSITDFSVFNYINLETDACENDAVNQFYIKNAFQLYRQYKTAEGRKMNEYRYYGDLK